MEFKNISFGKKIALLLAAPIIGFLFVSLETIYTSAVSVTKMTELEQLSKLSTVYSELVHELQKERGATAGYIGSKGTKFVEKLPAQRKLTNSKVAARKSFLADNEFSQPEIITLNSTLLNKISQLESIRKQVDQQSIKAGKAIGYYTDLNKHLISISEIIAGLSLDAKITKATVAYYSFIQGKERAGIERAVMSNTFARDNFGPGMLVKFITLVSEQNTYFNNFNAFANTDNKAFYQQQLNNQAVNNVAEMRAVALEKRALGNFGVDSEFWFNTITKKINLLKNIEDKLATGLVSLAQTERDSVQNILIFNLIQSIVLTFVIIFITIKVVKDLKLRVSELKNVMSKVTEHNDLTVKADLTGDSELGQISNSLNSTLDKFSGAISQITTSSTTLATAAEQTSITCDVNSQSLVKQQDEIGLIAAAVEQLSATVQEVAGNTQLTADSAKDANEQAQNGLVVVQKSYQSIDNLAGEINRLSERITSLHESSKNITNVVDVIKSVAEQTNLLALNAAIEAARAGEQGRGFAVVADEVRTLAQRTQDSTSEIESFISSLQADASSAYDVIETSQNKAAEAVESSKNVETLLDNITNAVNTIFTMTEQVAVAVEEQATVTQDVAQNVVSVEQKSMETTAGATQIATTAKEQAQLAETLQSVATQFKI